MECPTRHRGSAAVTDRSAAAPDDEGRYAAAFARYVELEIPVLYRVALSLTGQQVDAEDLVQDTIVRAYRAIDRFDGAHPRAWLLTILRNTHRNRGRIRLPALLRTDEQESDLLERSGASPSAEDSVVDAQFEAVVAGALTALPAIHRVVVQLVDVEGMTYAEAAQALGVPRGTDAAAADGPHGPLPADLPGTAAIPRRRTRRRPGRVARRRAPRGMSSLRPAPRDVPCDQAGRSLGESRPR